MLLFIGRFFAGIAAGSGPVNAELREDGSYELREDGTYELRE